MIFAALTIFPELFNNFKQYGIVGRAVKNNIIKIKTYNIRDFAKGKHKITDDRPYGGGYGMVMKPEPLAEAIRTVKKDLQTAKTILLTPQGKPFNQKTAIMLSAEKEIIFLCGRYEGVDERICADFIDEELSIGDFVLTGGEIPAMAVIDAVTRLLPESLGCKNSADNDTFSDNLIEYAHYTRPQTFEGKKTPDILLSGNHQAIENWRLENALKRTFLKRFDMLKARNFSDKEIKILQNWQADIQKLIDADGD